MLDDLRFSDISTAVFSSAFVISAISGTLISLYCGIVFKAFDLISLRYSYHTKVSEVSEYGLFALLRVLCDL